MTPTVQTVDAQLTIAAPPDAVFRAVTDPGAMTCWFAEHADVSLAEGRYDFWGRFTPETPDREQGRHPILAVEPGRLLRFAWRLRGRDTTVEITLTPDGSGTLLRLRHDNLAPRPTRRHAMADLWSLALENLRGWVERGASGTLYDFHTMQPGEVHLSVEIDAPASAVYEALVDPAQLDRWIADQATVEPRPGGRYDLGPGWSDGGPVKILDLVENERLTYSWTYAGEPNTVVTWMLDGSGGRTRLMLVHSGFAPEEDREDYRPGWLNFMNRIKHMLEAGPAWQAVRFAQGDYEELVSVEAVG